jgi:hypothetical protein
VFLDAETADLLRAHHRTQLRARMKAGPAWQDNDLVFCQPDGRPWNPDHVSKRFKKLAAQAGVPVIKLHEGGRHTGNSLMRDAGMDQEVRMREVGHAGRDINDRYTHVLNAYILRPVILRPSNPENVPATRPQGADKRASPQFRLGGAGGTRTHGRRIMRSTAPCNERASCTDGTGHGIACTRTTGIIWRGVPRTVPRGRRVAGHGGDRA